MQIQDLTNQNVSLGLADTASNLKVSKPYRRNKHSITTECLKAVVAGLWPVCPFIVARGQK